MLNQLYGFQDYKIVDNGSWVIEQYQDQELTYTCYLLKNGSLWVFIETRERFPKLVDAYEVPHAGTNGKGGRHQQGKKIMMGG